MRRRKSGNGDRVTACFALAALVVLFLGSTGAIALEPDAGDELCVGCSSRDDGACCEDAEDPLTSHHHCCATSCMTHASIAIMVANAAPVPVIGGPIRMGSTVAAIGRTPETPYRPPRG